MSKFWSPLVHELTPYIPGEQANHSVVKLNTNENPYPPSPKVWEVLKHFNIDGLRKYPNPDSTRLKRLLADYFDLTADHVFVGNGSDEVLAHTFHALFKKDQPIVFPDIGYSFYPVYCKLYDIDYKTIPLHDDFTIHFEAYGNDIGGIIFANPNAPTGIAVDLDTIEQLLKQHPDVPVVIDEAYVDFGADSAVALIERYPNLLIIQTFSKSRSLAGFRIGFALGQPHLIEALKRIKDSFNSYPLSIPAMSAAIASLEDQSYFIQNLDLIINDRIMLTNALSDIGFTVLPSKANFIFASHPQWSARDLFESLREAHILVRHFDAPRIDNFLRITIGSQNENQKLIGELKHILNIDI